MADINKPGDWWDEKIKSFLEWLTDEEKDKVFEILKQEKENRTEMKPKPQLDESLLWKPHWEVMGYLNKKYVKIKENQEFLGYKWRIIEINLPAVVDRHDGIKLKWFISDNLFSKQEYEANPKFEDNSYSEEEILNIYKWIDKYYEAISPWMEYSFDLIKLLVGNWLHRWLFRLKDKKRDWDNDEHFLWDGWFSSTFYESTQWNKCSLLLKISD